MNKAISTPIAITFIVLCGVLLIVVVLQYDLIPGIRIPLFIPLLDSLNEPLVQTIEIIDVVRIGFASPGIYEEKFIYNGKEYILVSDLSEQGMKVGKTVYYLQLQTEKGDKEYVRNYSGEIDKWEHIGGGYVPPTKVFSYKRNVYLAMSLGKADRTSVIIIKKINENNIIEDALISYTGRVGWTPYLWYEVATINNKIYFKFAENCLFEEIKTTCDVFYYFINENGIFIKDNNFEIEKKEILHN